MNAKRSALGLLLLGSSLPLALGCVETSDTPPRGGSASIAGTHAEWVTGMFHRPPDLVGLFRPYPGLDKNEVRVAHRKAENTALGFAYVNCRQADLYFYGDVDRYLAEDADSYGDGVEVIHGAPAGLDPLRPPKGDSDFVFVGQSGSGVRAYRERSATPLQARLFVLPSSTWIVSHGAIGQRLAGFLASNATEPPMLEAAPGSFAEETRPIDASNRERLEKMGWVPMLDDLDELRAVGRVIYPLTSGAPPVMGLKLVFSDERASRRAADEAMREPRLHQNGRFLGVDRIGTVVIIKSTETR